MKYLEAKALRDQPESKVQAPAVGQGQGAPQEPEATEAAVKLAAELGVDLGTLKGTGAEGRIIVSDVQAAADAKGEQD